jgi:hypothetical protein
MSLGEQHAEAEVRAQKAAGMAFLIEDVLREAALLEDSGSDGEGASPISI